MNTNKGPQAIDLPVDAFVKAAIALPSQVLEGQWEVFFGDERVVSIKARNGNADDVLRTAHRFLVTKALAMAQATIGLDGVQLPSGAVLADYPDLLEAHPLAAASCLQHERSMKESTPSRERSVIENLIKLIEAMLTTGFDQAELTDMVKERLKPARLMLEGATDVSSREAALTQCMRVLVDLFDKGNVSGSPEHFEVARCLVEEPGYLSFPTWLAGVHAELGVEFIDEAEYRPLYDKGLTPEEAAIHRRLSARIIHH